MKSINVGDIFTHRCENFVWNMIITSIRRCSKGRDSILLSFNEPGIDGQTHCIITECRNTSGFVLLCNVGSKDIVDSGLLIDGILDKVYINNEPVFEHYIYPLALIIDTRYYK